MKTNPNDPVMKIERPKFSWLLDTSRADNEFDAWFTEHVEPINKMLDEGKVLYGDPENCGWSEVKIDDSIQYNHKALLINIQPIKKKEAKDLLHEMIKMIEAGVTPGEGSLWYKYAKELLDG